MLTKEQYRHRLSEIYNQIGELASERISLIADRMNLVTAELEKIGIRYGGEYTLVFNGTERRCVFNGVCCNNQFLVYMEWLYELDEVVDINHDITIRLPEGGEIDYWEFMHQYI